MGYANGKLMGEEIRGNIDALNGYITEGFSGFLTDLGVPKFVVSVIS